MNQDVKPVKLGQGQLKLTSKAIFQFRQFTWMSIHA